MKRLHRYTTLLLLPIIIMLAATGFILSFQPSIERFSGPVASPQMSVSTVAQMATQAVQGVEQINKQANGQIIVKAYNDAGAQTLLLDPSTGALSQMPEKSGLFTFIKELHRSLFLGTSGKMLVGLAGFAMAMLSASGLFMLVKRCGGWRGLVRPAKGSMSQKWHVELSRAAALGLILISATALYMTAASFQLLPTTNQTMLQFPDQVADGTPLNVGEISALKDVHIANFRSLVFPFPDDPSDVYTLTTATGSGYIDQVSGLWLAQQENGFAQSLYETVYMLHTGQGLWWFGPVLGALSLSILVMATTGIVIWRKRQSQRVKIKSNAGLQTADLVIGVGSEGNSTWEFAATLHKNLHDQGIKVHVADLNAFAQSHFDIGKMLILTSTHGEGTAPANADKFLHKLQEIPPSTNTKYAVLGFGDTGFAQFCGFATQVEQALNQKGFSQLLPLTKVDKQCVKTFAQWGEELGAALGLPLNLNHTIKQPKTKRLTLISRTDYATNESAPISVFKFAIPKWGQTQFESGDLIGIIKDAKSAARYYSLASSKADGYVEICVKRHAHGICSTHLHDLKVGDTIDAFFKQNVTFRVKNPQVPAIFVSAGTGIAPLIGMARANSTLTPIHFYWGGRHPNSDFLYEDLLSKCTSDGRIAESRIAFSRVDNGKYVQSHLNEDAVKVRSLVTQGAQILVCGGSDMAKGLRETLNQVLAPVGTNVEQLKSQGRYLEDVY